MDTPAVVRRAMALTLAVLLTGIGAQSVRAQQSSLAPGTNIRVELRNGHRHQGRVIRSDRDSLIADWAGGSIPAFPVSDIVKFEAMTGRHRSVRRTAIIGAVAGGSLGAIGGALLYKPCESTEFSGCFLAPKSRSESAQVNGLIYGVVGLLAGGAVGLVPRDRWQRVMLDGSVVRFNMRSLPASGRGVGLALEF